LMLVPIAPIAAVDEVRVNTCQMPMWPERDGQVTSFFR
jgi:hypothetical protein